MKLYRTDTTKAKSKFFQQIFLREILCDHNNILKLHYIARNDSKNYHMLIEESIENTHFQKLYPQLNPTEIMYYAYYLLSTLEYIHERKIIHRNLKPGSIAIHHKYAKLKVMDWDAAVLKLKGFISNIYTQQTIILIYTNNYIYMILILEKNIDFT